MWVYLKSIVNKIIIIKIWKFRYKVKSVRSLKIIMYIFKIIRNLKICIWFNVLIKEKIRKYNSKILNKI